MSVWLAILLLLATLNPPRRSAELPGNRAAVAAGAGITLFALLVLGAAGESLLETLDISAPTFRVGVGLVLFVRGLVDLFVRPPGPGGELPGMKAALVPVFFPVLFRAEVALVAMSVAIDGGLGAGALGAAVALLLVVVARPLGDRWSRALGIVSSTLLIVLAVDRIVDGVFAL